jgi:hypothetical protein
MHLKSQLLGRLSLGVQGQHSETLVSEKKTHPNQIKIHLELLLLRFGCVVLKFTKDNGLTSFHYLKSEPKPGYHACNYMPVIPALGRLRQEDHHFEAS